METSDGYLWLATTNGLARYDGSKFKMFYSFYADSNTITGNNVTDLEEDRNSQLWISSFSSGLSVYNLKTGVWKQCRHPTPDGNPVYRICDLHLDAAGNMWIGTMGRGLLRFDDRKHVFTQYLLNKSLTVDGSNPDHNTVRKIADDPEDKNILWLACMDGLYRFDKNAGRLTQFENIKQGTKSWKDNCFHAISCKNEKVIWLGTWGGGVVSFDRITRSFSNYPYDNKNYLLDNLSTNVVFDLYPVSDTSLYVATSDNGLLEWNITSHQFHPVKLPETGANESAGKTIMGISVTSNNCLWLCGSNNVYLQTGVYGRFGNWQRIHTSSGHAYVYKPLLNDVLWLPGTNSYWMACSSGDGILEYDSNFHFTRSVYTPTRSKIETIYRCIRKDVTGTIWMQNTTAPYFYYYDKLADLFEPITTRNLPSPVSRFVIDAKNRLWTVTDSFLYSYNIYDGVIRKFNFNPEPASNLKLPITTARMVIDKNNKLWIGTNIGVWSFDTNSESWEHLYPGSQKTGTTLAETDIGAITVDEDNKIWIAPSSQGIQVYDPVHKRIERSFHVSNDPSFHSPGVTYLQASPDGNIWTCTYNGLAVWQRSKDQWKWFYQSDGLIKDYVDQPIIITPNGKALLAQYDGFIAFDPGNWVHNEFVPRLKITGINIDGNKVANDPLHQDTKIRVGSNQRRVSFSFAAIEPIFPDRVQYWYKLGGYDNDWRIATLGQVEYGSLSPGNYTFYVKAQNSDGLWSTELQIPVEVLTPFWKKWWFIPSLLLIMVLFAYLFYRYRLGQVVKMQEMRNGISRDLHDEIGSSVSSVNMLSAVARKHLEQGHPVSNMLTQIGESAQQAGESIDEIVWSLDPRYDLATPTFNRIRNHVSTLFESTGIEYTVELPEVPPGVKLMPGCAGIFG